MEKRTGELGALGLLLVLVSGCGDKFHRGELGFTEVLLRSGNTQAMDLSQTLLDQAAAGILGDAFNQSFGGEGIIYAINSYDPNRVGRKYISNMAAGPSVTWIIPNGDWKFFVIGYDSNLMTVGSGARGACGQSAPVSLNGGTISVPIATTTSACDTAPFAPVSLANFSIHFCNNAAVVSSASPSSTYCSSIGGTKSAIIQSAFMAMFEQDEFMGTQYPINTSAAGIKSNCVDIGSVEGEVNFETSSSGHLLRVGNVGSLPLIPFRSEIVTFTGTSCSGFYKTYIFPKGLAAAGTTYYPTSISHGVGDVIIDESYSSKWVNDATSGRIYIKD